MIEIKPGINFAIMSHDADCPAMFEGGIAACNCTPDFGLVGEQEFKKAITQNRKERRQAEKIAARAIKKAGKR